MTYETLTAETEPVTLPDDAEGAPEIEYVRALVRASTTLTDTQADVVTLAIALTHVIDAVSTCPRILALGEKGSGKSDVLLIADELCHNSRLGSTKQMTEPSIRTFYRMAEDNQFTLCADEISKLLGADGTKGETHPLYSLLLTGYKRKTAWSYRERNGVVDAVPTFGVVWASGIGKGAPDELRDRSIILRTEKLADTDPRLAALLDLTDPAVISKMHGAKKALHSWARSVKPKVESNMRLVRGIHPKLGGRRAETWGPLAAIALEAGGDWLARWALAFERIQLNNAAPEVTPADQVLLDYADYAEKNELSEVRSGAFWSYCEGLGRTIYMEYDSAIAFGRGLATEALGATATFRTDGKVARGWAGLEHELIMRRAQRLRDRIKEASAVTLYVPEALTDPYEDF